MYPRRKKPANLLIGIWNIGVGAYYFIYRYILFEWLERQAANKREQERAYQELADSISEEDRRFIQQNARKRKWKVRTGSV
jgi:hypothetical protein